MISHKSLYLLEDFFSRNSTRNLQRRLGRTLRKSPAWCWLGGKTAVTAEILSRPISPIYLLKQDLICRGKSNKNNHLRALVETPTAAEAEKTRGKTNKKKKQKHHWPWGNSRNMSERGRNTCEGHTPRCRLTVPGQVLIKNQDIRELYLPPPHLLIATLTNVQ